MPGFMMVIVLASALVVNAPATVQNQTALKHIDRATELLFVPENADKIHDGVVALVDAIDALAVDVGAPANLRTTVQAARKELVSGPSGTDKASGLLREAYRTLHGGTPFRMQAPSEDISDFMASLRRRMDSARSSLLAGRNDETVRALLGVALAVVTPVGQ